MEEVDDLVATLRSEANDDKTVLGAQTNKTKLETSKK